MNADFILLILGSIYIYIDIFIKYSKKMIIDFKNISLKIFRHPALLCLLNHILQLFGSITFDITKFNISYSKVTWWKI